MKIVIKQKHPKYLLHRMPPTGSLGSFIPPPSPAVHQASFQILFFFCLPDTTSVAQAARPPLWGVAAGSRWGWPACTLVPPSLFSALQHSEFSLTQM